MGSLNFRKILFTAALFMVIFGGSPLTYAQQASEQFIPIGMSPGISNKYSYIGKITAIDTATNAISLQSSNGPRTITISPLTRIWLDRSKNKNSSIVASFDDIKIGDNVEVMHSRENESTANWVKIESM
jgi:hypothetical protein